MKPGKFAITVDSRKKRSIIDVFKSFIIDGNIPSTFLVRKVFEEENSWESAARRLNNTVVSAPVYYIISGT